MKQFIKMIFMAALGSILEWYDFSIFAYLAPVIAILFFPHENKFSGIIATYAVFAVGFFARPLGAIIFGHFGDRIGRNKTLVWTISLISITTTLIGFLPTYSEIGIAAPILLTILRILQGFSIGGETTGSASFVLEHIENKKRGFAGAFLTMAIGCGVLAASFLVTLSYNYFNHADLIAWGWRIPFLLGIPTGIIGYYVRKKFPESQLFQTAHSNGQLEKFPVKTAFLYYKKPIFQLTSLYALSAVITYLIFIFMPVYVGTVTHLPLVLTTQVTTIGMGFVTFLILITGYLSDYIGRKFFLLIGALGFLISSYPLFSLIIRGSLIYFIIAEICFVILATCYQSILTATAQELVVTPVRYTVTALGYHFGFSIFGGTAPLIATYAVHFTGNKAIPGLYLTVIAGIALIAVIQLAETSHRKLI